MEHLAVFLILLCIIWILVGLMHCGSYPGVFLISPLLSQETNTKYLIFSQFLMALTTSLSVSQGMFIIIFFGYEDLHNLILNCSLISNNQKSHAMRNIIGDLHEEDH